MPVTPVPEAPVSDTDPTLPAAPTVVLTDEQEGALASLFAVLRGPSREAVLAGPAGTGKTTCMRAVMARWGGDVTLVAPTGKAARRLSDLTGAHASTVHSALYGAVEEERVTKARERLVFGERKALGGGGSLVVVDEASMVNRTLADDVRKACREAGAALLWVGDPEQLPPVEGDRGVPLDAPTALLQTVHRQALESPVLDLATRIRVGEGHLFDRWTDEQGACSRMLDGASMDAAVTWAEEAPSARILLTWTNRLRQHGNTLTRARRGLPLRDLVAGERIVVTFNQHGLGVMNGETFTVSRVKPCPELTEALERPVLWAWLEGQKEPVLVAPDGFDGHLREGVSERTHNRGLWAPLWQTERAPLVAMLQRLGWGWDDLKHWRNLASKRVVQCTYGYVLTAHKSQGSQYPSVGFVSCPSLRSYEDADFTRRLLYTAITRAEHTLRIFALGL
jgi:exodeoxyribonuclease-5